MEKSKAIRLTSSVHQRLLYYKVLWQKKTLSDVIIAALLPIPEVKPDGSSTQAEGNPTDHAELRP